jgi:glycosyltransferase involved in cell wall biosynthesis
MSLNKPTISVIITCFNSEKFLKETIQSVLNQTYKNFELIIVDDGSTDLTKKIVLDQKNNDKRIRIHFIKKNSGTASIPRNLGAKMAKGKYLAFLDSDDLWQKDKLKTQIKKISKDTILSFSSSNYIDENSKNIYPVFQKFRRFIQKKIYNKKLSGLYAYNPVILSSAVIKSSVFLKFKFDERKSLVGIEDLDLWLRIFYHHSRNIVYVKDNLVSIRRRRKSLNIDYNKASLRAIYCISKFFIDKNNFKYFHIFLLGIGYRALKALLKNYKKIIKKFAIILLIFITSLYIISFKTPAFWYAGKYLTYWDEPINSDAIVILSGNGGSNYINTGYQKRYLDVKKLVKKGDFKFIYLMGRKQEIEEYEILSALFISDGVDASKIKIIRKTFKNTKENIRFLIETLNQDNIQSINFVTAPYHTKRSKFLWDKYKGKIKVNILENVDKQKDKKWKTVNFEQIKIIFYEFFAIIYNKLRGYY